MIAPGKSTRMNARERALLQAQANGAEPVMTLRTRTRVDTGRWLGSSPVWLCATGSDIVLLTAGPRQHGERIALTEAQGSWYCHTTGQLVLEPGERLRFSRVELSPTDALRVLELIKAAAATTGSPAFASET